MKKFLYLFILLSLPCISGCAGCRNDWKHFQSNIVGLNRKITVYRLDGTELRSWKVQSKVEDSGGTCYFLTDDGKAVTVSGNFIIEEL